MLLSPKGDRRNAVPSRAIEPIKEDPDMADTDVLASSLNMLITRNVLACLSLHVFG